MSRLKISQGPSNVLVKKKRAVGREKAAHVQTNEKDDVVSFAKKLWSLRSVWHCNLRVVSQGDSICDWNIY